MKLQDTLPDTIMIGRRKYKVDLDFRNVLNMMETLSRDDLIPEARDYLAVKCVMKPPKNVQAALIALKRILFPDTQKGADRQKITDFVQDADLIRGAFLQSYNINLFRDKLHWLEFSSLLSCLPEGTRYSEILGIRSRPMPKATKYNAEERQWLAKAKAAYALEMTEKEAENNYNRGVKDVFLGLMSIAKGGGNHG